MALYEAKRLGGNRYAFFAPQVRDQLQQRASALSCARVAVERGAITPFYQPKVSLKTGEIQGFEALLRWEDSRGRIQGPGLIKEAFDDPILSVELGRTMFQQVLEDMRSWQIAGVDFGTVAINLSTQQFLRTDAAAFIIDGLSQASIAADRLEVEVTETVFVGEGSDAVGLALDRLHEFGVKVALDDFGTGYASLSHLNKFPVSWLKLDRSFVEAMNEDPNASVIVNAMIGLSHSLGLKVIAEGVETPEQWAALKSRGCDVAQGYLVSRPIPAKQVPGFVRKLREWLPPCVASVSPGRRRLGVGS